MAGGKLPPRQKMIGMMYLVLTALLAINVSSSILEAFVAINEGFEETSKTMEGKNEILYAQFDKAAANGEAMKVFQKKAEEIKNLSKEAYEYIEEIKKVLIREVDQVPEEVADTLKLEHVNSKDNFDDPSRIFGLSDPANPQPYPGFEDYAALTMEEKLKKYRENLLNVFDKQIKNYEQAREEVDNNIALRFPMVKDHDGMEQPWVVGTFYHKPLAAVISLLSKLQADVRTAEAEALAKLYEYIDASGVSFNKVEGFAYAKRAYVMEGDTFRAEIFTAAYDDRIAPEIYIGKYDSALVAKGETDPNKIMIGTKGETWGDGDWFQLKDVHGGKGYLKVKESIGQHEFSGVIIIKTKKGKRAFPFNSMFEVAKPSVTVAATEMNVFYVGIENPVSISAPVPQDKIQASGLGIRKKGKGWVVKPKRPGKGTIVVSAEIDGKKVTLGKAEFRVKRIPDPKAYVGKVTGSGAIRKSELLNLPGVFVKMEGFEFNVKAKIQSFKFVANQNGYLKEIPVKGSTFNNKCKSLIKKAKRNDRIYIEDIKVKMPDGSTRKISPVNLKVI